MTATPSGIFVQVGIGLLVVISIVGGIILLAKRGIFDPDTNEDSQDEREELASAGSRDFRIPYRKRVKSWSGPMKVFVGSLALLVVGIGVASYQIMKTGSPAQQYFTEEVRYGLVAVVGVAGGVHLCRWFDKQLGELLVTYERTGQANLVETIPYAKRSVDRRNGTIKVPEVADSRLFGLFWRYRQRGEDRRLRGGEKPLDDVISHLVPSHGDELPEGKGFVVTTRESGDKVLEGDSRADVTYASPNSLSDERATQIREEKKRKEAELKATQATNAELYQQIRKMRKKIKNEEYHDREELLSDFREFSEQFQKFSVSIRDERERGKTAKQNGDTEEANA